MAYTRDPKALFSRPALPPVPSQPQQLYRNVTLATDVGPFCAGRRLPFARVDWRTGGLHVFADEEDAANHVPSESVLQALPPCPHAAATARACDYAAEIADFLVRGHSLSQARCDCTHELSDERASALGVTPQRARSGRCALRREAGLRTLADVASELAVYDLEALRDCRGEPVLRHVRERWTRAIQPVQEGARLVGFLQGVCARCQAMRTREDLWDALIDAHCERPSSGHALALPRHGYLGMRADVQRLVAARYALLIQGADAELLYLRAPHLELPVDDDVRALWHRHSA